MFKILALSGLILFSIGCSTGEPKRKEVSKRDRARMLIEIGNGALTEGDPTGALENYLRAEELEPNLPELHHSKALAFYAKHDLNTAIASAKRAVEIMPNYADANNTLGKFLIDAEKYDEALVPLEVAAKDPLYREAYKAWTNLGIIKYKKEDFSKAEEMMTHAIQESPLRSCIAYYYRGHIKLRANHMDEAIKDYSQATQKICANFADAQYALGVAYHRNQKYDLARKTFLEIQKRFPKSKFAELAIEQLRNIP